MFKLTKEQEMIRAMVGEFARTQLEAVAPEYDARGEFPLTLVKQLAAQGIIGINIAKEFGGTAAGCMAGAIAIEEIAKVYPSLAFFLEVSQAPIYAIEHFGSEEQKNKYLPPVVKGEKVICVAATEPTGGSDLASIGTIATADGDKFIINGRKVYITNGGIADICMVLTKTGEKASTFIVEKGMQGLLVARRENQMGFKSIHISELAFNNCVVPAHNMLGKEGAGLPIAMTAFTVSRPSIGAIGLGIAEGAFAIALKYAKKRVLYGKPIGKLQNIQFMLAEMDTEIEKARWVIYYPTALLDGGASVREIGKFSARAKAVGADVAADVSKKAIQLLGGYGVSPEYRLAGFLNDAMELYPATGTVEIMKVIQAGEILR